MNYKFSKNKTKKMKNTKMKNTKMSKKMGGASRKRKLKRTPGRKRKRDSKIIKGTYNHLIDDDNVSFKPDIWNDNVFIKKGHNCYTYFLNKQDGTTYKLCKDNYTKLNKTIKNGRASGSANGRDAQTKKFKCHKPQPGYSAGFPNFEDYSKYTCSNIDKRIPLDNPNIIKPDDHYGSCPSQYYKGSLVVSTNPGKEGTYHFYRQDDDGNWSHKPGSNPATNFDADGIVISHPLNANRNYGPGRVNYDKYCNTYCVPRKKTLKKYKALPR